jgi:hypothetical protein
VPGSSHQPYEIAEAHRLHAGRAVGGPNLEGDPPLVEEYPIRFEHTQARIVDVRCLGRYSIQFQDSEPAGLQVGNRS